jgi:hypothetical protein
MQRQPRAKANGITLVQASGEQAAEIYRRKTDYKPFTDMFDFEGDVREYGINP